MASRYWVGGTGTWEDTAHWSDSSGGAGGFSVPTNADFVAVDASSGFGTAGTITSSGMSVDFYTQYDGIVTVIGDMTVVSDFTFYDGNLTFNGNINANDFLVYGGVSSFHGTIASNNDFELQTGDGVVDLYGDVSVGQLFLTYSGVLTAHDIDIFASSDFIFYANSSGASTVNMGGGIWATTSGWQVQESDGETVTINAQTSTIKFTTPASSYTQLLFSSDNPLHLGGTYNKVLVDNVDLKIFSSNTISEFTIDASANAVALTLCDASFVGASTQTGTRFIAHGSPGKLITITSFSSPIQQTLNFAIASVSYIDVKDNIAAGAGIPFRDFPGGVDHGHNVNWVFTDGDLYLQTTFLTGAVAGDVQTINAGKDDDGTPIFYELETQELEFSDRAHLKNISDQIGVVTTNGIDSQLQAREDDGDYKNIPIQFDRQSTIGKDINLEGNFFTFRWFGEANETSPILEELYLDNVDDKGMV